MKDEFSKQQLRATQYQHMDGGLELTFGGSFLLTSLGYCLVTRLAGTSSPLSGLLDWLPLIFFLLGGVLLDRLVQALRLRITYPRTGYLSPARPHELGRSTRLIIWIGVPALSVLILVILFLNHSSIPKQDPLMVARWMPVFSGLLLCGLWVIIGWKVALPRFYLMALVSLLVSAGLFLYGPGGWPGMTWLLGATGLSLFTSGGLTLWKYLRRNLPPVEISDEQ